MGKAKVTVKKATKTANSKLAKASKTKQVNSRAKAPAKSKVLTVNSSQKKKQQQQQRNSRASKDSKGAPAHVKGKSKGKKDTSVRCVKQSKSNSVSHASASVRRNAESAAASTQVKQSSTARSTKTTRRQSKRGANEASDVRYDRKHVTKTSQQRKKSKAKATTSAVDSDDGDSDSADGDSVLSGNEDDKGSVVSAILDEDICCECGLSTLDCLGDQSVVMCDLCDSETHISCAGFTRAPAEDDSFICRRCSEDHKFYQQYNFNVSDYFKVRVNTCFYFILMRA